MTYETRVEGRAGKLSVENGAFKYTTEKAEASGEFSVASVSVTGGEVVQYSLLVNGNSYSAVVLPNGEVSVNGRVYRVEVFDPRSHRGRVREAETNGRQMMLAPMPGRVIRVLVTKGQTVAAGEGLIVVEAMKMQNEMKSPKAGTVTDVRTEAGATVTAGDVLLVIE